MAVKSPERKFFPQCLVKKQISTIDLSKGDKKITERVFTGLAADACSVLKDYIQQCIPCFTQVI